MPVQPLTASLANQLAQYVLDGRVSTLHIERRDHVRHKGKHFVEYALQDESLLDENRVERIYVSEILEDVAQLLVQNQSVKYLFIKKEKDMDSFFVQFEREEHH